MERCFIRKLAVVVLFSAAWFLVSLVRMPAPAGPDGRVGLDASWVMALPYTAEQGLISGRDFQFTYGPLAQLLAYAAVGIAATDAFTGLPVVVLAFWTASIAALGAIVLSVRLLDWKGAAIIYVLAAALNLFSEPTAFRTLTVLAVVTLAYRGIAAPSRARAFMFAAGLACTAAQLVTIELGLYAAAATLVALTAFAALPQNRAETGSLKRRRQYAYPLYLIFGYLCGNLAVSLLFRLTSSTYENLFAYQYYALEMLRGFNNGMASPWEPGAAATTAIAAAATYAVGCALYLAWTDRTLDPAGRFLFLGLAATACIFAKTALTRSDIGHITMGFGPAILLLLLLAPTLPAVRARRVMTAGWAAAIAALLAAWPWAGLYAFADAGKVLSGNIASLQLLRPTAAASLPEHPAGSGLLADADTPLLSFPHDNSIAIRAGRPLVGPVLQSHNAATEALQRYYVRELDRQTRQIEVAYGVDGIATAGVDSVQAMTRTPLLFDFLYRNFETSLDLGDGFLLLTPRGDARAVHIQSLTFQTEPLDAGGLQLILDQPSACGIVRLALRMDYPLLSLLGKRAPVDLSFFDGETHVHTSGAVPIETGRAFTTFVSLQPAETFAAIFDAESRTGSSVEWDRLIVAGRRLDAISVLPRRIEIEEASCYQP